MSTKAVIVKKRFSEEMKRCCLIKYKEIPSNAKLVRDFSISTQYKLKVNQETFRLWMKGDSFPDLNSLVFLIEWLGLDLKNIFNLNNSKSMVNEIKNNELNEESIKNLNENKIKSIIDILNSFSK